MVKDSSSPRDLTSIVRQVCLRMCIFGSADTPNAGL